MKIHLHEQRTPEWYRARIGMPTASEFHKVMMGKGTKTRQDYMCRLVMERILGRSLDDGGKSKWMKHGIDTEAEAVAEFRATFNLTTRHCGLVTSDDGRYGCSPDQIVDNRRALVEIKCPAPWTHCRYFIYGPGDDYEAQVQGQLLVTEYETVYFYSYFPGLPAYCLETERDEKYIQKLSIELDNFCNDLDTKEEYIRKIGIIDQERVLCVLAELMPEDRE